MDKKLGRVFISSSTPMSKNDDFFKQAFIGGIDPINGHSPLQISKPNYSNIWYTGTQDDRVIMKDINGEFIDVGDRVLVAYKSGTYVYMRYAIVTEVLNDVHSQIKVKFEDGKGLKTKTCNRYNSAILKQ